MTRLYNDDIRMGEASIEEQLVSPISNTTFSRITDDDDTMPSIDGATVPVIPVYGHQDYTQAVIDSWFDNGGADVGTPGTIYQNSDVAVEMPIQYETVSEPITYTEIVEINDFTQSVLQEYQNDGWTFYAIYSDYTEDEVDYTEVFNPTDIVLQTVIDEASSIANAVNQHFWTDTNGVHVTEDEKADWLDAVSLNFSDQSDTGEHSNVLINSVGTLFRRRLYNLVSIARNAISFYSGNGNSTSNILAYFGTSGSQIGANNKAHLSLTPRMLGLTDYNNKTMFLVTNHAEDDGYTYTTVSPATTPKFDDSQFSNGIYVFHTYLIPTLLRESDSYDVQTFTWNTNKYIWSIYSVIMYYNWDSNQNKFLSSIDLMPYKDTLGFSSTDWVDSEYSTVRYKGELLFDGVAFTSLCYNLGIIPENNIQTLYDELEDISLGSGNKLFKFEMIQRDSEPRASLMIGNRNGSASGSYSIALQSGRATGEGSIATMGGQSGDGSFSSGTGAKANTRSIALAALKTRADADTVANAFSNYSGLRFGHNFFIESNYGSIAAGNEDIEANYSSIAMGASLRTIFDAYYLSARLYSAAFGLGNTAHQCSLAVGMKVQASDCGLAVGHSNSGGYAQTNYYNSTSARYKNADKNAISVGNGFVRPGAATTSIKKSNSFVVKHNGGIINCNYIATVNPDPNWYDDTSSYVAPSSGYTITSVNSPVFFELGNKYLWNYNSSDNQIINAATFHPKDPPTIVRVTGSENNVLVVKSNPVSSDFSPERPMNSNYTYLYKLTCTLPNNDIGYELANSYFSRLFDDQFTYDATYNSLQNAVYAVFYQLLSSSNNSWTYRRYVLHGSNGESYGCRWMWSNDHKQMWFFITDRSTPEEITTTTNPNFSGTYKIDFYYVPGEKHAETRLDADNYSTDVPIHLTFGNRAELQSAYPIGKYSTTLGTSLAATAANQLVIGKYNATDSGSLFIVGNGSSNSSRNNVAWITSGGQVNTKSGYEIRSITHIDAAPSSDEWAAGLEWSNSAGGRAAILEYGSLTGNKTLRLTLSGTPGTTYQSGLIINKSYGNTYTGSMVYNGDNGQLTVPGVIYADSGISWKANTNIACPATANSQEWSIDLNGGSYTGAYFHVWSGKNSKSILRCYNDDNSVEISNGPLTCGNRITASNGNTWTNGFVVRDTRMPLEHSFSAQTDSAGFFISPDLTASNFTGRMFMREYTNNTRVLVLETSRTVSGSRKYNTITIGLDSSGNPNYGVSNPANFRSAIGAQAAGSYLSTSGGTLSGDLTFDSNSDDSPDIVFKYANDREKSRIWTDNTYSSAIGPNYRVYKSDGTSLYSGRLATIAEAANASFLSSGSVAMARMFVYGADITKSSGDSGGINIRVCGRTAYIKIWNFHSTSTGRLVIGTIPSGYRPPQEVYGMINGMPDGDYVLAQSDGRLQVQYNGTGSWVYGFVVYNI